MRHFLARVLRGFAADVEDLCDRLDPAPKPAHTFGMWSVPVSDNVSYFGHTTTVTSSAPGYWTFER